MAESVGKFISNSVRFILPYAVNSQKAVDKALEIARSVKGVTSVKSDLIVKE